MAESEIISKTPNYCPHCNSIVETGIIFSYIYGEIQIEEMESSGIEIFLSKCLNCDRPMLTENDYHWYEDNCVSNKIQLYPLTNNLSIKNAPQIVVKPYQEATKCYRIQAYEACVIMCRKGIEAICKDKGEWKGNLASKIKNLRDRGILDGTLYDWTNELRNIGNDGAHSHDEVITQQDAKDTLDFFDALITYLYHLVDQYTKLKIRRAK